MDIQVSSNFERLVYLANNRDAAAVVRAMDGLKQSGAFSLASEALQSIRNEFDSGAIGEAETAETIRTLLAETGELLDPHTAVGVAVARKSLGVAPMVTLATAHPAKFPDAVLAASGIRPNLPQRLEHLLQAKESFTVLPNSVDVVKDFIKTQTKMGASL
jgi:threonine synthase